MDIAEKLLGVVVATEERVLEFRDINCMGRRRESERIRNVDLWCTYEFFLLLNMCEQT